MAERSASAQNSSEDDDVVEDLDDASVEQPSPILDVSWPLQFAKVEPTIYVLYRQWRTDVLDLVGEFQRDFVWDIRRRSRLVESVLTRIPLPVLYLSEENDGRTLVIDGEQRLRSLFSYYEGKYALEGLNFLPELNGKKFADLNMKLQRRFENASLACFVLHPGTRPEVKFEIFERLNAGGLLRTSQEMRNGLFPGPGLDLVRRLAHGDAGLSLLDVIAEPEKPSWSRLEEFMLRALAFMDLGLDEYRGDMNHFLNRELGRLNQGSPSEREALEIRARNALVWTKRVFGEHAFCWYHATTNSWASQPTVPLVEVILCGFDRYFPPSRPWDDGLVQHVLQAFQKLCGVPRFRYPAPTSARAIGPTKLRFDLWMKVLADVA